VPNVLRTGNIAMMAEKKKKGPSGKGARKTFGKQNRGKGRGARSEQALKKETRTERKR